MAALDRDAHAKVEAARAAKVLAGVVVGDAPLLDERRQGLLGTVGARVVDHDDLQLIARGETSKVLPGEAVEALEKQVLAVVGHDDGGDALLCDALLGHALLGLGAKHGAGARGHGDLLGRH